MEQPSQALPKATLNRIEYVADRWDLLGHVAYSTVAMRPITPQVSLG